MCLVSMLLRKDKQNYFSINFNKNKEIKNVNAIDEGRKLSKKEGFYVCLHSIEVFNTGHIIKSHEGSFLTCEHLRWYSVCIFQGHYPSIKQ